MGKDRHQGEYIPFRCSDATAQIISELAQKQHRTKAEILRELVDTGLQATGATLDSEHLYRTIKAALQEILSPSVERLAAINAKGAQISGAAFFMAMWSASKSFSPGECIALEEAASEARRLGIEFLKLKDRDLDAFIREGTHQIING